MSAGLFGYAGRLARDGGLSQQNVGGCGDVMHLLRDDLFELLPVGDPGAVELGLSAVEAAADGLPATARLNW